MIQQQTLPYAGPAASRDPNALEVKGQVFVARGRILKTASLKNDWMEDLADPEGSAEALKSLSTKCDILKFWQRPPQSEAKYNYYKEWRYVAAMPLSTHQHWMEKSLTQRVRNKVRRSLKSGVVFREAQFDDDFVRGIMAIFNECPLRRGKPMRHYGKSFESVKEEMGADMADSAFVGAYWQGELIGFTKFTFTDRYAMLTMILDKIAHRDKLTMNGLMSKTVEVCVARKAPCLTYTLWRRGGHAQFQETIGFVKTPVPEYFVPLTFKGRLALALRLHEGIKGWLPERVHAWLVDLKVKFYELKYRQKSA